jgi:hypothetical protein
MADTARTWTHLVGATIYSPEPPVQLVPLTRRHRRTLPALLQPKPGGAFDDAYVRGLLQKWDLLRGTRHQHYSYAATRYHQAQGRQLVLDLLNDPAARQHLQVLQRDGSWAALQGEVTHVEVEVVPATLTRCGTGGGQRAGQCPPVRRPATRRPRPPPPPGRRRLDLFDRLLQAAAPIVRQSGDIVKRMDDVVDGFQVRRGPRAATPALAQPSPAPSPPPATRAAAGV